MCWFCATVSWIYYRVDSTMLGQFVVNYAHNVVCSWHLVLVCIWMIVVEGPLILGICWFYRYDRYKMPREVQALHKEST